MSVCIVIGLCCTFIRTQDGVNAFHLSAGRGHVSVAQYLAPVMGVHRFDLTNAKDTTLHIAATTGHLPNLNPNPNPNPNPNGYLYSAKCHTVPYMYYSPILSIHGSCQGSL